MIKGYLGVDGLSREFIPPLTLLIVKQYHSVHSANSKFTVIRGPGHTSHFGRGLLGRQKKNDIPFQSTCYLTVLNV